MNIGGTCPNHHYKDSCFNGDVEPARDIFATPMGVSAWREHGKTYKYWSYFRNEVIDECTDIFYEPTLDIKPKLGIPKKIHLGALIRTNIFLYYADDIIKKLNKLKSPTSNPK